MSLRFVPNFDSKGRDDNEFFNQFMFSKFFFINILLLEKTKSGGEEIATLHAIRKCSDIIQLLKYNLVAH